ncbi:zinc finger protein [Klosneuvirus KNV1]|uniref:Zinc finger protein n=1 Tax=Klosneuvirus KNV1 TaxID=1977640 RepID=A0A1V0SJT3_9VIRU|nr:zinc finger protein [Klosneuvirus KNV1]
MNKFVCETCNYSTDDKSNYNKHMKSTKHYKKSIQVVKTEHIVNHKKSPKDYNCQFCKRIFTTSSNLTRHERVCAGKVIEKKELELELKYKDKELENAHKKINELEKALRTTKTAPTYNISIRKLIQTSYPDAPCLAQLDHYSIIHEDDEIDLTQDLIYYQKKNILDKYLGDIIIKYYKKENPEDQSIWSTDSARLNYIIKELMASNRSQWSEDLKGLKIKHYIIEPLLNYIKDYINDQIDIMHEQIKASDANQCRKIGLRQTILAEIREQIFNGILEDDIIKYITPSFRFKSDKTDALINV